MAAIRHALKVPASSQCLRSALIAKSVMSRTLARQARNAIVRPTASHSRRWLSSSSSNYAALASKLPTKPTVVLSTPSPGYIEAEEIDVELIPTDQVQLEITDRAAEVSTNLLVVDHLLIYFFAN